MANFTNRVCYKASNDGNDHVASVTVTAAQGETIGNVYCHIFPTAEPETSNPNLLNLQGGSYQTASAYPPPNTSGPYSFLFTAEVTTIQVSETGVVGPVPGQG